MYALLRKVMSFVSPDRTIQVFKFKFKFKFK